MIISNCHASEMQEHLHSIIKLNLASQCSVSLFDRTLDPPPSLVPLCTLCAKLKFVCELECGSSKTGIHLLCAPAQIFAHARIILLKKQGSVIHHANLLGL